MEDLFMNVILPAVIAAIVGYVSAAFKNALDARSRIDQELRATRIELYQALWKMTGVLPQWPKASGLTYRRLTELSEELRAWYYNRGGIYLSEQAKEAYRAVQRELTSVTEKSSKPEVSDPDYEAVRRKCSNLRSELTRDLVSRRRGFVA